MQELLDYLRQDEYENVYIIRGLLHSIRGFRYEIAYDQNNYIHGIAAVWEEERGATLRGDAVLCSKWFDQLYGQYNLYELEDFFVQEKLKESDKKMPKESITYNLIMVYTTEEQWVDEGFINYKRIDKIEWCRMAELFKERYKKEFIEFEPNSMEWLCVYEAREVIGTICVEKVDQDLGIISSFYVVPDLRGQGTGTRLLKSVLRDYGDRRLMLFVDQDNTKARELYERLGFKVHKRVVNIEI